jgi:HAD superfamily hydrolase (TIGR01509 family)
VHYLAWKRLVEAHGGRFSRRFFNTLNGMNTATMAGEIIKAEKLDISRAVLARLKKEAVVELLKDGLPLYPGVIATVKALKRRGCKVGLATMSIREHALLSLGKNKKVLSFNAIVSADDVKNGKPAPAVFLKCAKMLGESPRDCFVVEDAYNGIIAAHRAGMKVIAIANTEPRWMLRDADYIIRDIREVLPIVSACR